MSALILRVFISVTIISCTLTMPVLSQELTRVSISSSGVPGNYYDGEWSSINADGRYVAFGSLSSNFFQEIPSKVQIILFMTV